MAETVRSHFDYREPPAMDSDGEKSSAAPLRGRGRGRKRKGTPVKVCDRVFAPDAEEESADEAHEKRTAPPADQLYFQTPSGQLCVNEEAEQSSSGRRPSLSYTPTPNCRIREVHCGNQVRLIVIAIRNIARGEEIIVDYSLTEWEENAAGFHGAVPHAAFDSDAENRVKKEEDSSPMPISLSEYIRPSWSLSPSSSPVSRSDASHSDSGSDRASRETRVRRGRRRKSLCSPRVRTAPPTASPPVFKCPAGHVTPKQRCVYCGRHFRSLQRHLLKHHAHLPDVRSALDQENHTPAPPLPASPPAARSVPMLSSPHPNIPAPPPATPPRSGGVPVSVLKRSPPTPAHAPRRGRPRKIKAEPDTLGKMKGEPTPAPASPEAEKDGHGGQDESGAEDKTDLSSSRRPHMLPLLSSLSSMVLYLRRLQHSAFISISRAPQSAEAWRLLCHSSLALLILYNRRRECEVSKLTIAEYQARALPRPAPLTPLEASLSPFERMVLPLLPRVGVQGKRGRVQPLILPPHSEACLDLLLQTRPGVGIDPQNPYVFARPYHSPATPLRGTDLLRSLARSSGTRHPRTLTQTRVRRQVAILTQLLLLSEGEEEGGAATRRLESFLLKEYHVTQSCAAIGQDPRLMALVGRVVLCGERDGVLFRGMSLHHICLELDVLSGNSADSLSDESEGEQGKEKPPAAPTDTTTTTSAVKKPSGSGKTPRSRKKRSGAALMGSKKAIGKRGVLKRPWSEAERAAVESHLVQNIMDLRVPAKAECERCLQLCPLLVTNRRDWRAVKFYCHNRIQLIKKSQQRRSPPGVSAC